MRVACHAGPFNAAGFCGCPCACRPYSARQVASSANTPHATSAWDACTPTDLSAVDEPTCGRDASIACTPADLCAVDEPTCGRVARIGDAATLSGAAASGQRRAVTYVELDGRGCGRTLDEGAARHQRECCEWHAMLAPSTLPAFADVLVHAARIQRDR